MAEIISNSIDPAVATQVKQIDDQIAQLQKSAQEISTQISDLRRKRDQLAPPPVDAGQNSEDLGDDDMEYSGEASGKTILVVDDNLFNLRFLSKLLAKDGHSILAAPSAEVALELFSQNHIDALITDVVMDGMNGIRLIQQIRQTEKGRTLPVMICSSSKDRDTVVAAAKLNVKGYILKPLERNKVISEVRQALG